MIMDPVQKKARMFPCQKGKPAPEVPSRAHRPHRKRPAVSVSSSLSNKSIERESVDHRNSRLQTVHHPLKPVDANFFYLNITY